VKRTLQPSQDRIALVTGGGGGIGAAVAHRFAADGLCVVVADRGGDSAHQVVRDIERSGGRAHAVTVDVADADDVGVAIEDVCSTVGPPTVLVNNAGIIRDNLLAKMSESDWDDVVDVSLKGAFLVTRAVQPFMMSAGWGRVINMSSSSSLGNRGQANYAAAKAGLVGFTRTLAIELGPFGITVNAIAPGFVETSMTRSVAVRLRMSFAEYRDRLVEQIPVRRPGMPEDIAHAAAFFASEEAGFVSGQTLYVAGGPV